MSKRICIIGGTGFVGRAIARQAIDAGHEVVVTSRHPDRARDLQVRGIKVIKANIATGKGLEQAFSNSDCVINLVGLLFETRLNTFKAAHIQGAQNVIEACKNAGVPQLLHMSALLSDDASKNSQYGQSKAAAEELVRQSDLEWSIFRPSIIFGAHDSFLMRFKCLSSFGPVLPVISGDTRFQPVWVEDVARAFVLSIGNKQLKEQTFILAGSDIFTFKEMLNLWMSALGRCKRLIALPNFAASLLALISKLLPTPLVTNDQLILLKSDNVAQGQHFPEIFGQTASFKELLPTLANGGQAESLQCRLDQARTHYRKS